MSYGLIVYHFISRDGLRGFRPGLTQICLCCHRKRLGAFKKKISCTICVKKINAPIICAVTSQRQNRFSHDAAHMVPTFLHYVLLLLCFSSRGKSAIISIILIFLHRVEASQPSSRLSLFFSTESMQVSHHPDYPYFSSQSRGKSAIIGDRILLVKSSNEFTGFPTIEILQVGGVRPGSEANVKLTDLITYMP